jgi:hypothetical protein
MEEGPVTMDAAMQELCNKSIRKGTSSSYRSLTKRLTDAGYSITWGDFIKYLSVTKDKPSHSTVDGMKSAINKHYILNAIKPHATTRPLVQAAVDGWKARNAETSADRGPIEYGRLKELVDWLGKEKASPAVIGGIQLQWGFGLRTGQVQGLRRGDFVKLDGGEWAYIGARHKHHTKAGQAHPSEMHTGAPQVRDYVRDVLAECSNPDDEICPSYRSDDANRAIQQAAKALKWPTDLEWNTHCLRHGSATQAGHEGGVALVKARTAHLTNRNAARYMKDESERHRGTPRVQHRKRDETKKQGTKVAKRAPRKPTATKKK